MAALHRTALPARPRPAVRGVRFRERLLLLSRPAAERYRADGNPVGDRFLAGWDAFARLADPAARAAGRATVQRLSALVSALDDLPAALIHGDLKLGNVGPTDDGRVAVVDWQMVSCAPVAVELGWFLVSNVASLPLEPEAILAGYREAAQHSAKDTWEVQTDLAWLVGLLLRGWRKGLDAEAGTILPTGVTAADDLAFWCERALAAAERRL